MLTEENPVWAIAQADHAATAQHTSGQPYSAAEVKPCCCPSQAGRGCREETDPLFTVGKTKGFPLPWDIIQLPQTLALRAHFPSLPLCSCSRTFVAQLRCPELRGAQCLPLLFSVPAGTGLHSTVGMGLSAGPRQWKSCPCWPGSPGEYLTSRGCPLGAGLCLTTACAQALMDLCVRVSHSPQPPRAACSSKDSAVGEISKLSSTSDHTEGASSRDSEMAFAPHGVSI